jgi:hypothetical protein
MSNNEKYIVMIRFNPSNEEDTWITITEDTGKCDFNMTPLIFDSYDDAESYVVSLGLAGGTVKSKIIQYINE